MTALPAYIEPLPHQIVAIDTGFERPRFDAAYLLIQDGRAAFIDTGHNAAVPRLLGALDAFGLTPEAVDWVIPTHVHLDHAGGAGLLMSKLPEARALIHPRGARHLIDPSALVAGARAVYGDAVMRSTYGEIVPIPAERVVESSDGMTVHLAGRALTLIDTPGHARHHHCIWDEQSRGWFTGDTFGISYHDFDGPAGPWLFPSSTPVQFEPDALRRSIRRLLEREPVCLYPTHYSRVDDVARVTRQFFEQLDALESAALALKSRPDLQESTALEAALRELVERVLLASARAAGAPPDDARARELLALDIVLNAQGMAVWLMKDR